MTRTFNNEVGPSSLVACASEAWPSLIYYRVQHGAGGYVIVCADEMRTYGLNEVGKARADLESLVGEERQPCPVFFCFSFEAGVALRGGHQPRASTPAAIVGKCSTVICGNERLGSIHVRGGSTAKVKQGVDVVDRARTWDGPRWSSELTSGPMRGVDQFDDVFDRGKYERLFASAQEKFAEGETYQILLSACLARKISCPFVEYARSLWALYHSAKYHYYVRVGPVEFCGACSLPHICVVGDRVSTRVFGGTSWSHRDRGPNGRIHRESKLWAEHVMLVDVERDDIGRLSRRGSVDVNDLYGETIVGPTSYRSSTISGVVDPVHTLSDVVTSTLPRGVTTGAPKGRAIRSIADMEPPRGFYCGCAGLVWPRRRVSSNTLVTFAEQHDGSCSVRVGGGVLRYSTISNEITELIAKSYFLLSAGSIDLNI